MPSWRAPALVIASTGWVVALALAPRLPVLASGALYAAGALICHQIAERSFHLHGYQLPVCARCFGLYAGGAIGCLAAVITARLSTRAAAAGSGRYLATVLAALPTAITFVLEWGAGLAMSNTTRALAAVPLGAAVAYVVAGRFATLHYSECVPRRPIAPVPPRPPTST